MNTITISKPDQPAGAASIKLAAPDNPHAAHELFLFLAENLKPGFLIELAANGRSITQPSGAGPAAGGVAYETTETAVSFQAQEEDPDVEVFDRVIYVVRYGYLVENHRENHYRAIEAAISEKLSEMAGDFIPVLIELVKSEQSYDVGYYGGGFATSEQAERAWDEVWESWQ